MNTIIFLLICTIILLYIILTFFQHFNLLIAKRHAFKRCVYLIYVCLIKRFKSILQKLWYCPRYYMCNSCEGVCLYIMGISDEIMQRRGEGGYIRTTSTLLNRTPYCFWTNISCLCYICWQLSVKVAMSTVCTLPGVARTSSGKLQIIGYY